MQPIVAEYTPRFGGMQLIKRLSLRQRRLNMNVETANKLVKLRKSHNMSQEALAEQLGVSRQAVSKWERAESSPDTDNLIALAKLYGISVDELLNGAIETEDNTAKNIKMDRHIKHQQDAWAGIGSVIAVIIFLLSGFLFRAWSVGWIAFLIIPIFYYIPIVRRNK